jgi:hypothetical protein
MGQRAGGLAIRRVGGKGDKSDHRARLPVQSGLEPTLAGFMPRG